MSVRPLLPASAAPTGSSRPPRRIALVVAAVAAAVVLGAAACGTPTVPEMVGERRDLATVRAATARYQQFAAADEGGYTFLFLDACMVDPSGAARGAMGYHYVNTDLLDGEVDVATPEALLYEPAANGRHRLVAVEYVIPKAAWTGSEPPRLFGREFTLNGFDLWALHVWVWKDNPSGLYADWNPDVSCQHARAVAARAHH